MGGATKKPGSLTTARLFQSTRPWGARLREHMQPTIEGEFQSTRPWGARLLKSSSPRAIVCFNPRAHGGRDMGKSSYLCSVIKFQSTRPWGARQRRSSAPARTKSFNPRAHGGRDRTNMRPSVSLSGFNPRAHGGRDPT